MVLQFLPDKVVLPSAPPPPESKQVGCAFFFLNGKEALCHLAAGHLGQRHFAAASEALSGACSLGS